MARTHLAVVLLLAALPLAAAEVKERKEVVPPPLERPEAALERRVSFEFVDTPFTKALQSLQALAEVTIVLDPEVTEEADDPPITLKVVDMPLIAAVRWVARLAGLKCDLKDGAIYLSLPPEEEEEEEESERKVGEVELNFGGMRLTFDVTEADLPADMRREIVKRIIGRMDEEAQMREARGRPWRPPEERGERMNPEMLHKAPREKPVRFTNITPVEKHREGRGKKPAEAPGKPGEDQPPDVF